jgi:hypothetical protein
VTWARIGLCAGLVALSGCLPVVYVTPPARITASIGAQVGDRVSGVGALAGSLQPLHLFDPTTSRFIDVGVGWGARFRFDDPLAHGPFLELGLFQPIAPKVRFAAIARGQAIQEVGSGNAFTDGTSLALQLGVDWATWNDQPTAACEVVVDGFCGAGYAFGEGGAGGYVELGVDTIGGQQAFAFMIGFSGRLPATWGAGVIFLDWTEILFGPR